MHWTYISIFCTLVILYVYCGKILKMAFSGTLYISARFKHIYRRICSFTSQFGTEAGVQGKGDISKGDREEN